MNCAAELRHITVDSSISQKRNVLYVHVLSTVPNDEFRALAPTFFLQWTTQSQLVLLHPKEIRRNNTSCNVMMILRSCNNVSQLHCSPPGPCSTDRLSSHHRIASLNRHSNHTRQTVNNLKRAPRRVRILGDAHEIRNKLAGFLTKTTKRLNNKRNKRGVLSSRHHRILRLLVRLALAATLQTAIMLYTVEWQNRHTCHATTLADH